MTGLTLTEAGLALTSIIWPLRNGSGLVVAGVAFFLINLSLIMLGMTNSPGPFFLVSSSRASSSSASRTAAICLGSSWVRVASSLYTAVLGIALSDFSALLSAMVLLGGRGT